jgi:hypothetical protein
MVSTTVNTLVMGRSAGKDGHGVRSWQHDCAVLMEGRALGTRGRPFSPRPQLGSDIIAALHVLARERPLARLSFISLLGNVTELFVALDTLESISSFRFEGGAEDLSGQPWMLFTELIDQRTKGNHTGLIYSQVKRVVETAVRTKLGEIPPHFVLMPNPFQQDHTSFSWERVDDLNDNELRGIAGVLTKAIDTATKRIAAGRCLLPRELSELPVNGAPEATLVAPNTEALLLDLSASQLGAASSYLWTWLIDTSEPFRRSLVLTPSGARYAKNYNTLVRLREIDPPDCAQMSGRRSDVAQKRIEILSKALAGPLRRTKESALALGLSRHVFFSNADALVTDGGLTVETKSRVRKTYHTTPQAASLRAQYEELLRARSARRIGAREQRAIVGLSLPDRDELLAALALILMRTGFNLSTVLALKPSSWHRPHPVHNGAIEEIYAQKSRANGKMQYCHSNVAKSFHAYDLVRRVLVWTEPLRCLVRRQLCALDERLKETVDFCAKMALLHERRRLAEIKDRLWLTMMDDGSVREVGNVHWKDLRESLAAVGLSKANGQAINFSQGLTRRAWAIFNYEKSGSNLLLTKLAMGHADITQLLGYISRKREQNRNRAEWVRMQSAIIDLFCIGEAPTPNAVRAVLANRGLSTNAARPPML